MDGHITCGDAACDERGRRDAQAAAYGPPRRVSSDEFRIDVTGCLSLFMNNNQPAWIEIPGTTDLFLALFTTKERLDLFLADYPIAHDKIVQVEDGPEFLSSVGLSARVVIDPYKHENGRVSCSFGTEE